MILSTRRKILLATIASLAIVGGTAFAQSLFNIETTTFQVNVGPGIVVSGIFYAVDAGTSTPCTMVNPQIFTCPTSGLNLQAGKDNLSIIASYNQPLAFSFTPSLSITPAVTGVSFVYNYCTYNTTPATCSPTPSVVGSTVGGSATVTLLFSQAVTSQGFTVSLKGS